MPYAGGIKPPTALHLRLSSRTATHSHQRARERLHVDGPFAGPEPRVKLMKEVCMIYDALEKTH
jgi:hypothetical protein